MAITPDEKRICPACKRQMVPFDIVRAHVSYHGAICPDCGKWIYRKEDMNKRLEWGQVALMAETGLSRKQIAVRLGCSTRQVNRVAEKLGFRFSNDAAAIVGGSDEYRLWHHYYNESGSYSETARRFGVSRQAVWEKINREEAA